MIIIPRVNVCSCQKFEINIPTRQMCIYQIYYQHYLHVKGVHFFISCEKMFRITEENDKHVIFVIYLPLKMK